MEFQAMLEQVITLEPSHGQPAHAAAGHSYQLYMTAKRYWLPAFDAQGDDPDAITLVFLHATSFHKETWEPTVERLFHLATAAGGARTGTGARRGRSLKIREAWAVECPNHGQSAVLNERALQQPVNFTCEKYATAVHRFLSAGPDTGARIDFRQRNLVGVGHSLGGVAMTIVQQLEPLLPFRTMILIEPMLSPHGPEHFHDLRHRLVKTAYERRDVWPDRARAWAALKTTARWHPRVLELYVKYALRSHPGSCFPQVPYNGVSLACTRDQEAAMYRDEDGPTKPVAALNTACSQIPVHIILGEINDVISRKVHDALVDPMSGRHYASITRLKNVGHLVPQHAPDVLAQTLFNALTHHAPTHPRPKL